MHKKYFLAQNWQTNLDEKGEKYYINNNDKTYVAYSILPVFFPKASCL